MTNKEKIQAIEAYELVVREQASFNKIGDLDPAGRDALKGLALAAISLRVYVVWLTKGTKTSAKKDAKRAEFTLDDLKDQFDSGTDIHAIDRQLVNTIEERGEATFIAQRKETVKIQEAILAIINN